MTTETRQDATAALVAWLYEQSDKRLNESESRMHSSSQMRGSTKKELIAGKILAEKMAGRKLHGVNTSPQSANEYADVQERIARKLEREGMQLRAWAQMLEPNFPQSSSLAPQGAESADIGKLDTADKSGVEMGKVNRVDEMDAETTELAEFALNEQAEWGSAETGGAKAAPHPDCPTCGAMLSCASCNWPHYTTDTNGMVIPLPTSPNFRHSSQNQTVSSGVEGAHEGTTADKSGAELLPTQLPKQK